MSAAARPYALDLAALPIGGLVVAVDCWGEQPVTLCIIERAEHHVIGRTAAGSTIFVGGGAVMRMATADEAATFRRPLAPQVKPVPSARPAADAGQLEMF